MCLADISSTVQYNRKAVRNRLSFLSFCESVYKFISTPLVLQTHLLQRGFL